MVSRKVKFALWWRQSGFWWRAGLFFLAAFSVALLFLSRVPRDDSEQVGSSFLLFLLVNLVIVIVCVLLFLIGRNIVKLVFDRRRNILGARLRSRLVLAFVTVALVPTVVLFILASGLITSAMESWFNAHVEGAIVGAVEVARLHHKSLVEEVRRVALRVKESAEQRGLASREALEHDFEERRERLGLFSIKLYGATEVFAAAQSAAALIGDFKEPEPNEQAMNLARAGQEVVRSERAGAAQFIRVYQPCRMEKQRLLLITTQRLDPELTGAIDMVNSSYAEYKELKLFRNPLRSGYVLTLVMFTSLVLFAAIWFGFYIARGLTVPIARLAEGTIEVARGNYDFQIRAAGSDELGLLARSFNQMTRDLKRSTQTAQRRRSLIEAIFAHLAVGVITVDGARRITSMNGPAARLFSLTVESAVGKLLSEALPDQSVKYFAGMLDELDRAIPGAHSAGECEFTIQVEGQPRLIVCTAGRILGQTATPLGSLLLFDDVSELSAAQQMAAWREVARRIAHEIKNPLTPIRLSAQRIEKLSGEGPHAEVIRECAGTIVQNVDSIKYLADEFSHFARLPTAQLELSDLNALVADAVSAYALTATEVVFQFIPDEQMPQISVDREQIRRLMINLLENAVASFAGVERSSDHSPRVVARVLHDRKQRKAIIEVADNGCGIPDELKARIFEPYFTTKKGGTGLGLAVVSSIVSDHQGSIRVYDNDPVGTKVVIELSVDPAHAGTSRRLTQPPDGTV